MISDTILQLNNGATVIELTNGLAQIVAAVRETGKGGSISLTVKVKPAGKNTGNALMVEARVVTKLPEAERGVTIFYSTEDNQLVRNDPAQQILPLRILEMEGDNKQPLKEVL